MFAFKYIAFSIIYIYFIGQNYIMKNYLILLIYSLPHVINIVFTFKKNKAILI